jgi:hypothetical protein
MLSGTDSLDVGTCGSLSSNLSQPSSHGYPKIAYLVDKSMGEGPVTIVTVFALEKGGCLSMFKLSFRALPDLGNAELV